jgi:hypothetical protein
MEWGGIEIRVEKSPDARGSAEQWVRERFPIELRAYRMRQAASALIAMVDADVKSVQERIAGFENRCKTMQVPFGKPEEAVAIIVPKRNIETWIHHLNGNDVNEEDDYPKLKRERDRGTAVQRLVGLCKSTGRKAGDVPESLAAACEEYGGISIVLQP